MGKPSNTPVNDLDRQKVDSERLDDTLLTPKEQQNIIRRVDRRLIVMLGLLHTVALIDRGNIGTAAVAGMKKELHLVGTQYVCCHWDRGTKADCLLSLVEYYCSGLLPSIYPPADLRASSSAADRPDLLSLWRVFYMGSSDGMLQSIPRWRTPW
jgi:hypothetical protein